MMTSSNGNIFRVTGSLCREFTGRGEFPAQRPVTRSFDVFFDLCPNKRLSKQPWGWWFETPSWSLWRQCNGCRNDEDFIMSLTHYFPYMIQVRFFFPINYYQKNASWQIQVTITLFQNRYFVLIAGILHTAVWYTQIQQAIQLWRVELFNKCQQMKYILYQWQVTDDSQSKNTNKHIKQNWCHFTWNFYLRTEISMAPNCCCTWH